MDIRCAPLVQCRLEVPDIRVVEVVEAEGAVKYNLINEEYVYDDTYNKL
jgi:hypothetical protein